ncbi:MAG: pilus assembly protein PilM [Chlamydiota bacterium]|nr:pilus assembly protein PilM [Chlamydiota bacterium]
MAISRTVIFWDSDQLKIIRGNPHGGEKIDFSLLNNIKHWSESEISQCIREEAKKKGFQKDQIVLLIPRSLATMKIIDLPKASEIELKTMVEYQLTKIIPYPKSEIVYDFSVIASDQPSTVQLRLVYVHRKSLNRYLNILHSAGFIPSRICLDSEFYHTIFKAHDITVERITSLMHIDTYSSVLVVYQDGCIAFSRSLPFGTSTLINNQDNINDFLNEMETSFSLAAHQQDLHQKPIYIAGLSGNHVSIADAITERFKQKCIVLDYDNMQRTDTSIDMVSVLWFEDINAALNFIPPDIDLLYKKTIQRTAYRKLSISLMIFALLACWIIMRDIQFQKNELASIRKNIENIKDKAQKLDKKRKDILEIENFWNNRTQSLNILLLIFESTPAEIKLKSLSFTPGRVTLRGYAPDLSHIFTFSTELKKIQQFESIKTHFARQVTIFNKDLAEFHLECMMNPNTQRVD